ncbi:MAG TPA: hypothetical protein PLU46_03350 [Thiotrichales bacterium]|jgi:hypothetical protein|nr:hypothetical protein [Thiotrichales bacterium]
MKDRYSYRNNSNNHYSLSYVEQKEFDELVDEISSLGFSASSDVSAYIVRNKLGQKYRHISGVVTMEANGRDWRFVGGFPTHIYAKLCETLGLSNNGSYARVVGFRSFNQLSW